MTVPMPKNEGENLTLHGLDKVLRRLSTHPQTLVQEREHMPNDPHACLEALLREIDEVVLPRSILIQSQGQDIAALAVSNRRLSTLSLIQNGERKDAVLGSDTEQIAMHLVELSKSVSSIKVKPVDSSQAHAEVANDVSVPTLRAILQLDRQGFDIEAFRDLLTPISRATLSWSDDNLEREFSGDSAWREKMEACADKIAGTEKDNAQTSKQTQQSITGIAIPMSDAELMVLAYDGAKGMCFVTALAEGFNAIGNWQAITS